MISPSLWSTYTQAWFGYKPKQKEKEKKQNKTKQKTNGVKGVKSGPKWSGALWMDSSGALWMDYGLSGALWTDCFGRRQPDTHVHYTLSEVNFTVLTPGAPQRSDQSYMSRMGAVCDPLSKLELPMHELRLAEAWLGKNKSALLHLVLQDGGEPIATIELFRTIGRTMFSTMTLENAIFLLGAGNCWPFCL